jgi:hypothetical protein
VNVYLSMFGNYVVSACVVSKLINRRVEVTDTRGLLNITLYIYIYVQGCHILTSISASE